MNQEVPLVAKVFAKMIADNQELPLITSADDITPENCPEMFTELCNGCEEGEGNEHE